MNPIFIYIAAALNLLTFTTYAIDKALAKLNWRRIPESTLLTQTLLGGSIGALLAMILCRHKTRKTKFWICTYLSLAIQLGGAAYLIWHLR